MKKCLKLCELLSLISIVNSADFVKNSELSCNNECIQELYTQEQCDQKHQIQSDQQQIQTNYQQYDNQQQVQINQQINNLINRDSPDLQIDLCQDSLDQFYEILHNFSNKQQDLDKLQSNDLYNLNLSKNSLNNLDSEENFNLLKQITSMTSSDDLLLANDAFIRNLKIFLLSKISPLLSENPINFYDIYYKYNMSKIEQIDPRKHINEYEFSCNIVNSSTAFIRKMLNFTQNDENLNIIKILDRVCYVMNLYNTADYNNKVFFSKYDFDYGTKNLPFDEIFPRNTYITASSFNLEKLNEFNRENLIRVNSKYASLFARHIGTKYNINFVKKNDSQSLNKYYFSYNELIIANLMHLNNVNSDKTKEIIKEKVIDIIKKWFNSIYNDHIPDDVEFSEPRRISYMLAYYTKMCFSNYITQGVIPLLIYYYNYPTWQQNLSTIQFSDYGSVIQNIINLIPKYTAILNNLGYSKLNNKHIFNLYIMNLFKCNDNNLILELVISKHFDHLLDLFTKQFRNFIDCDWPIFQVQDDKYLFSFNQDKKDIEEFIQIYYELSDFLLKRSETKVIEEKIKYLLGCIHILDVLENVYNQVLQDYSEFNNYLVSKSISVKNCLWNLLSDVKTLENWNFICNDLMIFSNWRKNQYSFVDEDFKKKLSPKLAQSVKNVFLKNYVSSKNLQLDLNKFNNFLKNNPNHRFLTRLLNQYKNQSSQSAKLYEKSPLSQLFKLHNAIIDLLATPQIQLNFSRTAPDGVVCLLPDEDIPSVQPDISENVILRNVSTKNELNLHNKINKILKESANYNLQNNELDSVKIHNNYDDISTEIQENIVDNFLKINDYLNITTNNSFCSYCDVEITKAEDPLSEINMSNSREREQNKVNLINNLFVQIKNYFLDDIVLNNTIKIVNSNIITNVNNSNIINNNTVANNIGVNNTNVNNTKQHKKVTTTKLNQYDQNAQVFNTQVYNTQVYNTQLHNAQMNTQLCDNGSTKTPNKTNSNTFTGKKRHK